MWITPCLLHNREKYHLGPVYVSCYIVTVVFWLLIIWKLFIFHVKYLYLFLVCMSARPISGRRSRYGWHQAQVG